MVLGSLLGLAWKITPAPTSPPTLDQYASAVSDSLTKNFPWLAKPLEKTLVKTQETNPDKDKSARSEAPFVPCEYPIRFTQERHLDVLDKRPYGVRVVIFPKKINAETLPFVRFRATSQITYGFVNGVMISKDTGDPLAAGVNLEMDSSSGSYGVMLMGNEFAFLAITDKDKFYSAKNIEIDFAGPKPFDVTCVEVPPTTQGRYIVLPSAGAPVNPNNS